LRVSVNAKEAAIETSFDGRFYFMATIP